MPPTHQARIEHRKRNIIISSQFLDDHIFQRIAQTQKFYEASFLSYFQYVVRQPGAIIDAGANIGNHSLFFSIVMGRQTYSFEPNPTAYNSLQENLRNNQSTAKCFQMGLSDIPGNAAILSDGVKEKNIGMAKLGAPTEHSSDVKLTSIDEFLLQCSNASIAAIKIDVEGYEPRVLSGAKNTLEKQRPSVFAEAQNASSFESIQEIMEQTGYQAVHVMGATPMWHFAPNERHSEHILSKTWTIKDRAVRRVRRLVKNPK